MIRLFLLLTLWASTASAEKIVLGLSQDEVAITATFDGSDILIFGAVERDSPPPDGSPLEVIVTVAGPLRPVTVRRMERRFGVWANAQGVDVDAAPTFYAVATSAPMENVLSRIEDLRYKVTIPRAIRAVGTEVRDAGEFIEALIRIRITEGSYQRRIGAVSVENETLFHTRINLPSNLTEGSYTTRIFLTRGGQVLDVYETAIPVQKVGIERWLYSLAHEKPLIYGLLSLAIAILAGWGASAVFGLLPR